jgi:hypothetical protein
MNKEKLVNDDYRQKLNKFLKNVIQISILFGIFIIYLSRTIKYGSSPTAFSVSFNLGLFLLIISSLYAFNFSEYLDQTYLKTITKSSILKKNKIKFIFDLVLISCFLISSIFIPKNETIFVTKWVQISNWNYFHIVLGFIFILKIGDLMYNFIFQNSKINNIFLRLIFGPLIVFLFGIIFVFIILQFNWSLYSIPLIFSIIGYGLSVHYYYHQKTKYTQVESIITKEVSSKEYKITWLILIFGLFLLASGGNSTLQYLLQGDAWTVLMKLKELNSEVNIIDFNSQTIYPPFWALLSLFSSKIFLIPVINSNVVLNYFNYTIFLGVFYLGYSFFRNKKKTQFLFLFIFIFSSSPSWISLVLDQISFMGGVAPITYRFLYSFDFRSIYTLCKFGAFALGNILISRSEEIEEKESIKIIFIMAILWFFAYGVHFLEFFISFPLVFIQFSKFKRHKKFRYFSFFIGTMILLQLFFDLISNFYFSMQFEYYVNSYLTQMSLTSVLEVIPRENWRYVLYFVLVLASLCSFLISKSKYLDRLKIEINSQIKIKLRKSFRILLIIFLILLFIFPLVGFYIFSYSDNIPLIRFFLIPYQSNSLIRFNIVMYLILFFIALGVLNKENKFTLTFFFSLIIMFFFGEMLPFSRGIELIWIFYLPFTIYGLNFLYKHLKNRKFFSINKNQFEKGFILALIIFAFPSTIIFQLRINNYSSNWSLDLNQVQYINFLEKNVDENDKILISDYYVEYLYEFITVRFGKCEIFHKKYIDLETIDGLLNRSIYSDTLNNSFINQTSISDTMLNNSVINDSFIADSRMLNCIIENTTINNTILYNCTISNSTINNCVLDNSILNNSNLSHCEISNSDLNDDNYVYSSTNYDVISDFIESNHINLVFIVNRKDYSPLNDYIVEHMNYDEVFRSQNNQFSVLEMK